MDVLRDDSTDDLTAPTILVTLQIMARWLDMFQCITLATGIVAAVACIIWCVS